MKTHLQIFLPLKNERGVAALMGIVMGILIIGTIAFNFLAESRQKQSGSILTYTSTNAFMIAEAGLRYTQKCLLETEATCPSALQGESDWTNIDNTDNFNHDFGNGNFAISFPGSAGNPSGSPNDADNIRVISVGTYKGGQRSIQRFISRGCLLHENAATSCVGTTTNNNSSIDPEPDEDDTGVCPEEGIVDDLDPVPSACSGCPNAACPDFSAGTHLDGSNFLIPRADNYFCNMAITGTTEVKTTENDGTNTDDNILVAEDFSIDSTATLKLSDDASDPDNTDETIITVYGDTDITNLGDIRVNGALSLLVGGTFELKNSARINNVQGDTDDTTAAVEGAVTIKNSASFKGALLSDGTITIKNNGEVEGALQGNEVVLKNNASLVFSDGAGSDTTAIGQCSLTDVPPAWSE